jgi:hypothetical protein
MVNCLALTMRIASTLCRLRTRAQGTNRDIRPLGITGPGRKIGVDERSDRRS